MPHSRLFFLLSALLLADASSLPTIDHKTLLTIKTELGNPAQLASWKSNNYCSWTGVSCVAGGGVNRVSFHNLNLTGTVPTAVCSLKRLIHLDFSSNNLTGAFPAVLYGCTRLKFLDLSNNAFDGILPDDIGRLSPLLTELNLTANNFSGLLPTALGKLPALKSLLVDANKFTGQNPESFSSLKELTMLDMSANDLSGAIPVFIWQLPKLQKLYLFNNELTGELPSNITAVNLVEIDMSSNKLKGSIPDGFGTLKKLTKLILYFNELSGTIPPSIGFLPNLQHIQLYNNMLSGVLPPELGKHSPLANVEIPNNNLSGSLPDHLCSNGILFNLVVFNNSFSGELPASIINCPSLDNIMISSNNFSGEFPVRIWSLPLLRRLMINKNNFTGAMPSEIPLKMSRLEMGDNSFSGSFPASAPGLLVFKAENNKLTGELPGNMSRLGSLIEVSVSGNNISGCLPMSVASLRKLNSLNLSDNGISCEIPPLSIGLIPSLALLDLSSNALTGGIPPDFSNLNFGMLNLSSNNLTGEVPQSLQITVYNRSFLGNSGLCAKEGTKINLPTCGHVSGAGGHDDKPSTRQIIHWSVLCIIIILGIGGAAGLIILWLRRRWKGSGAAANRKVSDVAANHIVTFSHLTFSESAIMDNIREHNVIGIGGCGKLYRMLLSSPGSARATVVAVKKIGKEGKLQEILDKEFESEAKVLGNIRHRNIVRLLGYVSRDDAKLLIYEYMEKGSLHSLLHHCEHEGGPQPLDWPTRLSIAVDVARGLSYMHNDQVQAIVHQDIKSANILLDSDFRAKIADFGLARMLVKSGESQSVSFVGGTYGYMPPEYFSRQKVSEKRDVYSFGVVLLELTTGQLALGRGATITLPQWARQLFREGHPLNDAIDQHLHDPDDNMTKILTVFRLGLYCTTDDSVARPTMKEVLYQLEQVLSSSVEPRAL